MTNKTIVLCIVDAFGCRHEVRYFDNNVNWDVLTRVVAKIINKDLDFLERAYVPHRKVDHILDDDRKSILEVWKFDKQIDFDHLYYAIKQVVGLELWAEDRITSMEGVYSELLVRC